MTCNQEPQVLHSVLGKAACVVCNIQLDPVAIHVAAHQVRCKAKEINPK